MSVDMAQHFTTRGLLQYTAPSIAMMVFMSIYSVVDGFFVSNFVGSIALAAINFVYPIPMILGTVGFMLGTGGSAIVAKTLGEGDTERANRYFSFLVYMALGIGVACIALGLVVLRPVLALMGAQEGEMLSGCITYGTILICFLPGIVLQYSMSDFAMAAGKPRLGFVATVATGLANVGLDALFIVVFGWGIAGSAVATGISELLGGLVPLVYFFRPNGSMLRFGRTRFEWPVLSKALTNGLSEMVSTVSMSVVSMVYNFQLLRLVGEPGVAAYGVIMYVSFLFLGVFSGYTIGASPLLSFQYGAGNKREMRSLLFHSVGLNVAFGVCMLVLSHVLALPLANLFVGYDAALRDLAVRGLSLYAIAFLFMGLNIYGSSFFTALNNGVVSAIISFVRTLIFEIGAVLLLPLVLGSDGIWLSVCVAEVVSLVMTAAFVIKLAPRYGYLDA